MDISGLLLNVRDVIKAAGESILKDTAKYLVLTAMGIAIRRFMRPRVDPIIRMTIRRVNSEATQRAISVLVEVASLVAILMMGVGIGWAARLLQAPSDVCEIPAQEALTSRGILPKLNQSLAWAKKNPRVVVGTILTVVALDFSNALVYLDRADLLWRPALQVVKALWKLPVWRKVLLRTRQGLSKVWRALLWARLHAIEGS